MDAAVPATAAAQAFETRATPVDAQVQPAGAVAVVIDLCPEAVDGGRVAAAKAAPVVAAGRLGERGAKAALTIGRGEDVGAGDRAAIDR